MTDATTTSTDKAGEPVLLPCPFCGGTNTDPKGWMASDIHGKITQGPTCDDCDAAAASVAAWNTRTHPHPSLSVGLDREAVFERVRHAVFLGFEHGTCEGEWEPDYAKEVADKETDKILALPAPAEGYVLVPVGRAQDIALFLRRWGTVQAKEMADSLDSALPAAPTGGRS